MSREPEMTERYAVQNYLLNAGAFLKIDPCAKEISFCKEKSLTEGLETLIWEVCV
jgi:hypothetical protein